MRFHLKRSAIRILITMGGLGLLIRILKHRRKEILPTFLSSVKEPGVQLQHSEAVNNTAIGSVHPLKMERIAKRYWASKEFYDNDRIIEQLKYNTDLVLNSLENRQVSKKKILVLGGHLRMGQEKFLEDKCKVNTCELIRKTAFIETMDAIVFLSGHKLSQEFQRPASQVWIVWSLESPYSKTLLDDNNTLYNWTATYRHDSDIVAPYGKFVQFDNHTNTGANTRNYAAGKTKKVAWVVSNCVAQNQRGKYARELSKYIDVDIYGKCGMYICPKTKDECLDILNTDYKFYLSFENANCRDYITEKFFFNGLKLLKREEVLWIIDRSIGGIKYKTTVVKDMEEND